MVGAGIDGSQLSVPNGDAGREERRAKLESQLTHCFYYLAQVREVQGVWRGCAEGREREGGRGGSKSNEAVPSSSSRGGFAPPWVAALAEVPKHQRNIRERNEL